MQKTKTRRLRLYRYSAESSSHNDACMQYTIYTIELCNVGPNTALSAVVNAWQHSMRSTSTTIQARSAVATSHCPPTERICCKISRFVLNIQTHNDTKGLPEQKKDGVTSYLLAVVLQKRRMSSLTKPSRRTPTSLPPAANAAAPNYEQPWQAVCESQLWRRISPRTT